MADKAREILIITKLNDDNNDIFLLNYLILSLNIYMCHVF